MPAEASPDRITAGEVHIWSSDVNKQSSRRHSSILLLKRAVRSHSQLTTSLHFSRRRSFIIGILKEKVSIPSYSMSEVSSRHTSSPCQFASHQPSLSTDAFDGQNMLLFNPKQTNGVPSRVGAQFLRYFEGNMEAREGRAPSLEW